MKDEDAWISDVFWGLDPYETQRSKWKDDLWPGVTYVHLGMYLLVTLVHTVEMT